MILGTPTGRRRMPAVASEVPPDPPAEMMPPTPRSRSIQRANASAMAPTACAAVAGKDRARSARMHRGDLHRRHVGARNLARGRKIDGADLDIQRAQPIADVTQFGALGIESADHQRRAADALGDRDRKNLAIFGLRAAALRQRARRTGADAPAVRQAVGPVERFGARRQSPRRPGARRDRLWAAPPAGRSERQQAPAPLARRGGRRRAAAAAIRDRAPVRPLP